MRSPDPTPSPWPWILLRRAWAQTLSDSLRSRAWMATASSSAHAAASHSVRVSMMESDQAISSISLMVTSPRIRMPGLSIDLCTTWKMVQWHRLLQRYQRTNFRRQMACWCIQHGYFLLNELLQVSFICYSDLKFPSNETWSGPGAMVLYFWELKQWWYCFMSDSSDCFFVVNLCVLKLFSISYEKSDLGNQLESTRIHTCQLVDLGDW